MLTVLFHCPECDQVHDDPFEAAHSLLALCHSCGLAAEHRLWLLDTREFARAA